MSTDTPAEAGDQDALADEWAAALAEQKPEGEVGAEGRSGALEPSPRVEDASHVFQPLSGAAAAGAGRQDIDMILDIPVQLTVELGRTRIPIKHILQLAQGSVIELDALAGEPMDVLVNGCLIAQGEVVVVNDKFGIRLTDIVTPSERVRRLNRT
ncbi:MAG: flagellar motor switch protein FliN [Burkholderiales bacterium]|jgi:flagellar motor switch protein FliN/FliY